MSGASTSKDHAEVLDKNPIDPQGCWNCPFCKTKFIYGKGGDQRLQHLRTNTRCLNSQLSEKNKARGFFNRPKPPPAAPPPSAAAPPPATLVPSDDDSELLVLVSCHAVPLQQCCSHNGKLPGLRITALRNTALERVLICNLSAPSDAAWSN
jgi:hypothetical protein